MGILKSSCYKEWTDCQHAIILHVGVVFVCLFSACSVWPHFQHEDFTLFLLHFLMWQKLLFLSLTRYIKEQASSSEAGIWLSPLLWGHCCSSSVFIKFLSPAVPNSLLSWCSRPDFALCEHTGSLRKEWKRVHPGPHVWPLCDRPDCHHLQKLETLMIILAAARHSTLRCLKIWKIQPRTFYPR